MKRQSFAPFYIVFLPALLGSVWLRVRLKLTYYDAATGFYTGGALASLLFNILLPAAIALLFLISLLRRPGGDYPLLRRNALLPPLFTLLGLAILLTSAESSGLLPFENPNPGLTLPTPAREICAAAGLIAAIGAIVTGLRGIKPGRMRGGPLPLPAGIWMLVSLVTRFNAYETLLPIADNLLAVLFMTFAAIFFTGHARTLSGLARKDGRNYVIPAGLSTTLCAFSLVLPNFLCLLRDQTLTLPALHLGTMESLFICLTGIYAFLFVHATCKSIAPV